MELFFSFFLLHPGMTKVAMVQKDRVFFGAAVGYIGRREQEEVFACFARRIMVLGTILQTLNV